MRQSAMIFFTVTAVIASLALLMGLNLNIAGLNARITSSMHNAEASARSAIVTAVTNAIEADPHTNPQTALPATINTTASPCPATSTDPICKDTLTINATLEGGTGGPAQTNAIGVANMNTATGSDAVSGVNGTPIQGHAVYQYTITIKTPAGTTVATGKNTISLTLLNSTTDPVIVDAAVDRLGNGNSGYDRVSAAGWCAPGATCNSTVQATPQPGVSITDTRVHGQLLCQSTGMIANGCAPTGQATATPAAADTFKDVNVTDNANGTGVP